MTPTDLETLRGLVELANEEVGLVMLESTIRPTARERELARRFNQEARNAIPALTALLADYERMREWILDPMSVHQAECATWTSDAAPKCTCGLDALRATLKEENHD